MFIGLGMIVVGVVGAAQLNSLSIGSFTIDATDTPVTTVKPPTRSGTLAITADIPLIPQTTIAGQANFVNGAVTIIFPVQASAPVCVATDVTAASPVRRTAVTVSSVTFEGVTNHAIEYICATKNN